MTDSAQLQKIVLEYFEDTSDKTFSKIVKAFVFDRGTDDFEATGKLNEFIDDNGLSDVLVRLYSDKVNPNKIFLSTSLSERNLIEDLHYAFLIESFNRFKVLVIAQEILELKLKVAEKKASAYKAVLETHSIVLDELVNDLENYE